jgi:hypothetical protein
MPLIHITCRMLWLPKDGNSEEEYEDAAAPTEAIDGEFETFRCAVADGATETSFSRSWANLLVNGFREEQERDHLRALWQAEIPTEDLPWYAEEKASNGAFAALAGLTLLGDGTWQAEAVGDSCIIQARDDEMLTAFPLEKPDQFNNRPALLCSKTDSSEPPTSKQNGNWQAGDRFLLLTDAMARWLLAAECENEEGIKTLWHLENDDEFHTFVREQRALLDAEGRPKLHNDDLTLLLLEVK